MYHAMGGSHQSIRLESSSMIQYFKGRNLTHLGCALGVTLGLLAGLILGALLASAVSLGVAIWAMFGTTLALGIIGWLVGAFFSPRASDGS